MSKIVINERNVVVPGDLIAEGMDVLPGNGTYRSGDKLFASRVGLVSIRGSVIKIIPLRGRYIPQKDDLIVGEVISVGPSSWAIDMRAPDSGSLTVSEGVGRFVDINREDITRYFDIGDLVFAKIVRVTKTMYSILTARGPGLGKLDPSMTIEVNTTKVPRIIGKKGSMLGMLKQETGAGIVVGQNGIIWVKGNTREEELKIKEIILFIEKNSHKQGLTEQVKKMLEAMKSGKQK